MTKQSCDLEAAKEGGSILKGYDPVTDQWSYTFDGPFWQAVERAHRLGWRGAGALVAVIDTECDLSIPALRNRVTHVNHCMPAPLAQPSTEHGTAVALLIAKVAPECRFNLYPVQREDGTIDAYDVAHAVGEAAISAAGILNLSLGHSRKVPDLDERIRKAYQDAPELFQGASSPQHFKWALLNQVLPDPDCVLCQKAAEAARAGKLVFAAAGNGASEILCPARAEEVFAAGFQLREKRALEPSPDGGLLVSTNANAPVEVQAIFVDLPLEEVSGVLGTSFASPLYAGVGALGVTAAEFACYLSAMPMMTAAIVEHNAIKIEAAKIGHPTPQMTPRLQQVLELYLGALERLPHVHSEVEFKRRRSPAGVTITDPSKCIACGFLAYPLYINFGLFLLEWRHLPDAKALLEVGRAIAPWSDAAAADLGRTLEELGDLEEALSLTDTAVTLAPGIQPYQESQKRIKAKLDRA
jgi:tetratricopeptide (TPR) repeat protein